MTTFENLSAYATKQSSTITALRAEIEGFQEQLATHPPPAAPLSLKHYFPLRPTYLAELELPCDLTMAESERLCAFIHALVTDESKE